MAETFECRRELVVDVSADRAWSWISNLRNVMTTNQFHHEIDADEAAIRNPSSGMDVPILHKMMGHEFYRIARIMKYEDYEVAWGERVPEGAGYEDSFPHSEGWRVEPLGPNQCRLHNYLRGRFRLPIGQLIGRQAWDAAIPIVLDNDLQDVALAIGAIKERREIPMPAAAAAMLRLVHAREIDGMPVQEFLDHSETFLKPH